MNVIINARDAMPAGGTVTILAENRIVSADELPGAAAGEFVKLSVQDTGSGIPREHLEKVMEPFFTTKEVGKGSGLGLSMVYGFAKQSNGAFKLDSEPGEGTTVELWLPRAPECDKKIEAPASEDKRLSSPGKLRVLLVDDHEEVRSTTAAMLCDYGHDVIEAASGVEALEILKNRECDYDLLITDYAMPHVSGADFLRQARTLCPDVPALIITGYADVDSIADPLEGVDVLLKPFTPRKLEAAIARICDSKLVA
jgi:CheY-like chemotaxis protein